MILLSRRRFLRHGGLGAAALGFGGAALLLPEDARATPGTEPGPSAGRRGGRVLGARPRPTRASSLGPFHRTGAPYRAKVSPLLAPGTPLVIRGRVWAYDIRRPLPGAVLDVWQADAAGSYSSGTGDFGYRARLVTDESGAYEMETIHPAGYHTDGAARRAPHVHLAVSAHGYRRLVTEIFFEGDEGHQEDPLFHPELLAPLQHHASPRGRWESAEFEIVLEPESVSQRIG